MADKSADIYTNQLLIKNLRVDEHSLISKIAAKTHERFIIISSFMLFTPFGG